jgi:hypothetical protein
MEPIWENYVSAWIKRLEYGEGLKNEINDGIRLINGLFKIKSRNTTIGLVEAYKSLSRINRNMSEFYENGFTIDSNTGKITLCETQESLIIPAKAYTAKRLVLFQSVYNGFIDSIKLIHSIQAAMLASRNFTPLSEDELRRGQELAAMLNLDNDEEKNK